MARSVLPVFVPFARDRFESITRGDFGSPFALTFHYRWIDVRGKATLGIRRALRAPPLAQRLDRHQAQACVACRATDRLSASTWLRQD